MPRIFLAALAVAILPLAAQDKPAPVNTPPRLIRKVEPVYSEEGRNKKIEGTVVLKVTVGTDGRAIDIHVMKPLGAGLDQNAIDAVEKYLFKPGTRDGEPVTVFATVEVPFRLK
jgi:TonB family protein